MLALMLAFVAVGITACSDSVDKGGGQAVSAIDSGSYRSVEATDSTDSAVTLDDLSAEIVFSDGRLRATVGCNEMKSEVSLEGSRLLVRALAMTERACGPQEWQEDWLSSLLIESPDVRSTGAGELVLETESRRLKLLKVITTNED